MIKLKTPAEIEIMRQGGKILALVIDDVIKQVKPGISTQEINDLAERLIKKYFAKPSFKGYKASWASYPFPSALCLSLNHEVVHGMPSKEKILREGDILGIDCGLEYRGYFTDMAKTVGVGKISRDTKKLLAVTEEALMQGIKQAKVGNKLSNISRAIQATVEKSGFSVVRQLVGHGIGDKPHEDPQIPNYVDRNYEDIILKRGMVLAIEPMVNVGDFLVETLPDDWTIVTVDSSLSAHFEHTLAVTDKGGDILTI